MICVRHYLWLILFFWLWGCSSSNNDDDHNKDQEDSEEQESDTVEVVDSPFAPTFTLLEHDPDKTDDGLTLFAVQGGEETFSNPLWLEFGYVAAIPMTPSESSDEIVPEWVFADFDGGSFSYIDLLPNGRLLAMRGEDAGTIMVELDPTVPEKVSTYDDVMYNHYAVSLPDGNILAIYSEFHEHERYGYDIDHDGKREIRIDSIRVVTPEGDTLWEWSVFEHDPDAPVSEAYVALTEWWANCNAVSFIPKDDWTEDDPLEGDIYLNCRLLNRLYNIEYPSGDLRWIMGEGGDFGEGFFYHSHDPQVSFDYDDDGNRTDTHILLYDNREAAPLGDASICPPDETCP
jgi:hypothetical protein